MKINPPLEIFLSEEAKKDLEKLPAEIRKKFHKKIELFKQNPDYPSLDLDVFHPHKTEKGLVWRIRIDRKYRAVLIQLFNDKKEPSDCWEVVKIGKHDIMNIAEKYLRKHLK